MGAHWPRCYEEARRTQIGVRRVSSNIEICRTEAKLVLHFAKRFESLYLPQNKRIACDCLIYSLSLQKLTEYGCDVLFLDFKDKAMKMSICLLKVLFENKHSHITIVNSWKLVRV